MRVSLSIAATVVLSVLAGSLVSAEGFIFEDGIGADVEDEVPDTSVPETTVPPVICFWGSDQTYYATGRTEVGDYVYMFLDQRYWRVRPLTGEVWVQSWRVCRQDGETISTELGWRPVVAPDPAVIAQSLYDRVVRQVPVPVPVLNPPGPGFANLGMWLAVADPGPVSATATAGSVWATTTAVLVSTTFDMGDGTVVSCAGVGTPLPGHLVDTVDESPECGHTYTDLNGRTPFPVTVTSTWSVSWTGSGGSGGDLGTLTRSTGLDYRVLEIQTVGE